MPLHHSAGKHTNTKAATAELTPRSGCPCWQHHPLLLFLFLLLLLSLLLLLLLLLLLFTFGELIN